MDNDMALWRLVDKAREYVLVTRDLDAHLWEIEEAARRLDRAAVICLNAGATQQEVDRVTTAVAKLMDCDDGQTANSKRHTRRL